MKLNRMIAVAAALAAVTLGAFAAWMTDLPRILSGACNAADGTEYELEVAVTGPDTICLGDNAVFSLSAANGPIASYVWTAAGPATPSTGTSPMFMTVFTNPGIYAVSCNVVGSDPPVNGPCIADAVHQTMVIYIKPVPAALNVAPSDTTNHLFGLSSDSFAPSGVSWSLTPSVSNGASIVWADSLSAVVVPGLVATTYQVHATSLDNPVCTGMSELRVSCCEPNSFTDVTLIEGSFPWDQPSYAWSSAALPEVKAIESFLDSDNRIVQYMIDNVLNELGELKPESISAKAYMAKRFLDKCCLDCPTPDCWQIGKYRYRSLRPAVSANWNNTVWEQGGSILPLQITGGWNAFKPALQIFDAATGTNYATQIQSIVDTFSFGASVMTPFSMSMNTHWTHESDHCRKCPGVCPSDPTVSVPPCYTGFMRAGINGVVFKATASSGAMETGLLVRWITDWNWHGSRIGLINKKEQWGRNWGRVYTKKPFQGWIGQTPFVNTNMPLSVTNIVLCM